MTNAELYDQIVRHEKLYRAGTPEISDKEFAALVDRYASELRLLVAAAPQNEQRSLSEQLVDFLFDPEGF